MTELRRARFVGPPEHCQRLAELLAPIAVEGDRPEFVCVYWPSASRKVVHEFVAAHAGDHLPQILVLGGGMPKPYLARVMSAKLDGVVLESDAEACLAVTTAAVLAGQRVVPQVFKSMLDAPVLSSREKQILAMVILDMPNAEIAQRLHVTESNVKGHLSSAFAKLGVASRSAAAALILDPDAGLGPGILRITPESSLDP